MDYVEITGIIVVIITASWKIIEEVIRYKVERKLKQVELENISSKIDSNITNNWVQWSQKLEARVKEAEETIVSLKEIIQCQKIKLIEMEQHNRNLSTELQTLKNKKNR